MGTDVLAARLPGLGPLAYAFSTRHREDGHVVFDVVAGVVGEAQSLAGGLAREREARDLGRRLPGVENEEAVAAGPGAEPAIDAVGAEPALASNVGLQTFHHLLPLQRLGVPLLEKTGHRATEPEVFAVEHLDVEIGID